MSLLAQVFSPQIRAADIKQLSNVFGSFPVFPTTSTLANQKSALTLSAFYNAVDILSDDIAKLPKHIFFKDGEKRNKDQSHHLNYLLSVRPNGKMTPYTFWKTIETIRLIKGNCYVQKEIDQNTGKEIALHIRKNEDVTVYEDNNQLWYKYKGNTYPSADFLHFIGFSTDGKLGVGVVAHAAKSLGVALESQDYGQTIYKNRGLSYGTIETETAVDPTNKKAIETAFSNKLATKEVHNVAILDEGFKYKSIAITPAEAQFLETNKNGILEVCRWLNIAPHLLKDLTQANYSNIYQQSIEHVQLSVLPRVIAKEQELNYKCLTKKEQASYYIKFNIASLLRGDLESKSKFYTSMVYASIYTPNEVRALEDLNPIDGLDQPLQPVNMQSLAMAQKLLKEQSDGKE